MTAEFTDGGGTAFPGLHEIGDVAYTTGGLTKREWFAGQALAGLCASIPSERVFDLFNGVTGGRTEAVAALALADALMRELRK